MKSLTLFLMLCLCLQAQAEKLSEKKYFQSIDPKVRLYILKTARVKIKLPDQSFESGSLKETGKDNTVNKIDVVKYLSDVCGFEYSRNAEGHPVRPTLECTYNPRPSDNGFNGMTAKFDCDFERTEEKNSAENKKPPGPRTLKVKYDPFKQPGGGYKEIPQAIMGTLFARLLGFHTGTYCPADVICKDCPNDNPWELSNNSKGPAAVGSRVKFENVVISINHKGFKIMDTTNNDPVKAIGFYFKKELNKINPSDKTQAAELKTERDALTLWINFARNRDAGAYNTKLYCVKSETSQTIESKPVCLEAAALINDYGNSFGYAGQREKIELSKFKDHPLRNTSFSGENIDANSSLITVGANGTAEPAGIEIGDSGRKLFVKYAESITDQQLDDIFRLAQIHLTSDSSVEEWKSTFKKKVKRVKDH